MSHARVNRCFQEFAQDHESLGDLKTAPFQFFLVDGTKVPPQGPSGEHMGQVEMGWALASLGTPSRFEPVGFWINSYWAKIRKDLSRQLKYRKLKILFSDGARGIEENLLHSGMDHHRCLWHGKRDFLCLLYADGARKVGQLPFLEKLQSIPTLNFTKPQWEQLCPEDRHRVEQLVHAAGLSRIIEGFES